MHEERAGSHDGIATVTSAVAQLWPTVASRSVITRRPPVLGVEGGTRSFTVVPTLGHPRYLVPRSPHAAAALKPGQPGFRGLWMRVLFHLQRAAVLHRLPGAHVHLPTDGLDVGIEGLLDSMLGNVSDVVVRLGRPRPNRTLVVWAFSHAGDAVAIAKLSTGEVAHRAMEVEYDVLASAPATRVLGLTAPDVLGYVHWHDADVLVITVLQSRTARPSQEAPVAQMQALAETGALTEAPLRETRLAARLARDIERLVPESDQVWLRDALAGLMTKHGDTVVRTGAWHGDWVSWNMLLDGNEILLWDWEHYTDTALAGFDHVHFLAQEERGRGTDRVAEDRWVVEATQALRTSWGLTEQQCSIVLRAYLIEVNLRFVRDRQDEQESWAARRGWGRPLLERLALERDLERQPRARTPVRRRCA